MKLTLLLIPLLLLFPNITFASITKEMACSYTEGIYQESLETTGLKNASVSEFHKRDYYDHSELLYIVRQSNMYKKGLIYYDDYSTYSYNCKTRKPYRSIWQLTFREVLKRIPSNTTFTDAKIRFIGGNYIDINWYPKGVGCKTDTCELGFYKTSINLTSHTFTVAKRILKRGPNEYDAVGTYSYSR